MTEDAAHAVLAGRSKRTDDLDWGTLRVTGSFRSGRDAASVERTVASRPATAQPPLRPRLSPRVFSKRLLGVSHRKCVQ